MDAWSNFELLMKKLFIILIMLVYGVTSSGMTITLHYCCGKLDDISLTGNAEKRCPMGGKHIKNTSCCKDTQLTAKLTTDQQTIAKWVQASHQGVVVPASSSFPLDYTAQYVSVNRLARGTPVPISSLPLFIKHCVFRI
jgi:hypothetical protein